MLPRFFCAGSADTLFRHQPEAQAKDISASGFSHCRLGTCAALPFAGASGWCVVFLLLLSGCGPDTFSTKKSVKPRLVPQLTVLVVDDPALGESIKSEWRSRTEDEVIIRKITWKEVPFGTSTSRSACTR